MALQQPEGRSAAKRINDKIDVRCAPKFASSNRSLQHSSRYFPPARCELH
jgi:hypothetical protein